MTKYSVSFYSNIQAPIFPKRCVVCDKVCDNESASMISSPAESSNLYPMFSGRAFSVAVHRSVCKRKLALIWSICRYGVVGSPILGFLVSFAIMFFTSNLYAILYVGFGAMIASIISGFISRNHSPLQIYQIRDGAVIKFIFLSPSYAREFCRLNSTTLDE